MKILHKYVRALFFAGLAAACVPFAAAPPFAQEAEEEETAGEQDRGGQEQSAPPGPQAPVVRQAAPGTTGRTTPPGSRAKTPVMRPAPRTAPVREQESQTDGDETETEEAETGLTETDSGAAGAAGGADGGAGLGGQGAKVKGAAPGSGSSLNKAALSARPGGAPADTACHPLFLHRPAEARGKPGVADVLLAGAGPSRSAVSRHVLLRGSYLYVSGEPGLQTIDVSDPERMKLASDWTKSALKVNGSAWKDSVLYVANWSPHVGLVLFDLSNPAKPARLKTIATPIHAWDAAVTGNLLDVSVGNETKSAILTFNIKDPRNPVLLNTLTIDDRLIGNASRYGSYLYVTHKQFLYIYDASDLAKPPRRIGEMTFGGLCGDTKVRGGYLFVQEGGVRVLSLQDPAKPAEVAALKLAEARGMHFQGNKIYVPASGSGIYTVDISDPAKPSVVSNWTVAWPGMGHGGYPVTVDGAGDYIFVGATGGNNPGCSSPASCACYGGRVYSVRK